VQTKAKLSDKAKTTIKAHMKNKKMIGLKAKIDC